MTDAMFTYAFTTDPEPAIYLTKLDAAGERVWGLSFVRQTINHPKLSPVCDQIYDETGIDALFDVSWRPLSRAIWAASPQTLEELRAVLDRCGVVDVTDRVQVPA